MSEVFTLLKGGAAPILIVGDHASRHVPADIDLGIAPHLMNEHIACDIGVAEVAGRLVEALGCSAVLCGVSRLVIDCNRDEHAPGLIPHISDGHVIPGNEHVDREARLARFYRPYHAALEQVIAAMGRPLFILSLHSFTPALASHPDEQRPWEIGILYNDDDRGARVAIPLIEAEGWLVGDQLPYSGKLLNYTMNRHVEANGIPYLGVEMRQDLVSDAAGQAEWAEQLARILPRLVSALA